jgi:hypothetical protein
MIRQNIIPVVEYHYTMATAELEVIQGYNNWHW